MPLRHVLSQSDPKRTFNDVVPPRVVHLAAEAANTALLHRELSIHEHQLAVNVRHHGCQNLILVLLAEGAQFSHTRSTEAVERYAFFRTRSTHCCCTGPRKDFVHIQEERVFVRIQVLTQRSAHPEGFVLTRKDGYRKTTMLLSEIRILRIPMGSTIAILLNRSPIRQAIGNPISSDCDGICCRNTIQSPAEVARRQLRLLLPPFSFRQILTQLAFVDVLHRL